METRAELWERFKPRLAEAKKQDRLEHSALFLPAAARIGRFEVVPLTFERLLVLETLDSPFLSGGRMPTRRDVLLFLWVLSPGFRFSRARARLFMLRHALINWPRYIAEIGELMLEASEVMGMGGKDEGDSGGAWAAMMIDGFASQYGWTMREILDTPVAAAVMLGRAMGNRLSMGKGEEVKFSRHADRVRGEYLRECSRIDKSERGPRGR